MDGRNIPGFYFDPEKKKYFRIQDSHTAPPSQAKYTKDNVRKQEDKAKAERSVLYHQKKQQKETVVRRHTRDVLKSATLDREVGGKRTSSYMHGLWPGACVFGMSTKPSKVVNSTGGSIGYFDRDPYNLSIYAKHGDNTVKRHRADLKCGGLFSDRIDRANDYMFEDWETYYTLTSSISSLSYLPNSGSVVITTLGSDRAPVVYISNPDKDGPRVGQQFTPKSFTTIRGAAARPISFSTGADQFSSVPTTNAECLAVAASEALLLFDASPSGEWDVSTVQRYPTDVMALDWLSPTTVVLGGRNGQIRLFDTRSKGSSHILTHPQCVTKLRRADDPTRIICAGLQDSLFLYDIRSRSQATKTYEGHYNDKYFNEQYPGPNKKRKRKEMKQFYSKNWSQPVINFQTSNLADTSLDIAVQPDLGLLAAAQDENSSSALRVYNIWTGAILKDIRRKYSNDSIKCLKFMFDHDQGIEELWFTEAGSIVKMSMG